MEFNFELFLISTLRVSDPRIVKNEPRYLYKILKHVLRFTISVHHWRTAELEGLDPNTQILNKNEI